MSSNKNIILSIPTWNYFNDFYLYSNEVLGFFQFLHGIILTWKVSVGINTSYRLSIPTWNYFNIRSAQRTF